MGGSHLQRPQVPEVPQPFQRLGPGKGHGERATHTALDCSLLDMHSTTWVPCLPDRSWCELGAPQDKNKAALGSTDHLRLSLAGQGRPRQGQPRLPPSGLF